jgi:hypothetical protein
MNKLMTTSVVETAMKSDEDGVVDALKLAFVADPATRWVWPDPQKYLSNFSVSPRLLEEKHSSTSVPTTLKIIPEQHSDFHQKFTPILTE